MMKRQSKRGFVLVALIFMTAFAFLLAGQPAQAKVKLNKKTIYLAPKLTYKLKITGTRRKVTWKSSNKKIAQVSKKGKVTAKKTGKVTITAKVKGKKYKCKVYVVKKSRYNARKLRDFVVKKGKKYTDGDGKTYYAIEANWPNEEDTDFIARIEAYKDKNPMRFTHIVRPDTTAGHHYDYSINIDLINGSSGRFDKSSRDAATDEGYTCWGKITTAFDGKGSGVTVSAYYDVDSGGTETPVPNPASYSADIGKSYAAAFQMYDKLLKKYKAGVTMNSIGFSKWK